MVRLRHVEPYTSTGYTRRRSGKGFSYLDGSGRALDSEERARAEALVIPPAWTDVWIADRPNAHILAVGVDDAGRRQYIYHPDWTAARDAVKFDRMRELAASLPVARGRVTRDLAVEGLSRERILATSFRLLDLVAVRVGAEAYFEANGSFGLSTLLVRHVKLDGEVMRLAFPAKSGQKMRAEVTDAALAAVSAELLERTPRSRYLAWQDDDRLPGARRRADQRLRAHGHRGRLHGQGLPHPARHHRGGDGARRKPARRRRSGRRSRPCARRWSPHPTCSGTRRQWPRAATSTPWSSTATWRGRPSR